MKIGKPPYEYWVSDGSPKGYLVEQIFKASLMPPEIKTPSQKKEIQGSSIRYIDWLFPGILAMNMMFSALWGVGYVVVRYRKNGALKRLKVTPLNAFEYLGAQAISRIFLLMFTLIVVWTGCELKAVRRIMHDGAGLMDVGLELIILATMTLAFLIIGASLFSWE